MTRRSRKNRRAAPVRSPASRRYMLYLNTACGAEAALAAALEALPRGRKQGLLRTCLMRGRARPDAAFQYMPSAPASTAAARTETLAFGIYLREDQVEEQEIILSLDALGQGQRQELLRGRVLDGWRAIQVNDPPAPDPTPAPVVGPPAPVSPPYRPSTGAPATTPAKAPPPEEPPPDPVAPAPLSPAQRMGKLFEDHD